MRVLLSEFFYRVACSRMSVSICYTYPIKCGNAFGVLNQLHFNLIHDPSSILFDVFKICTVQLLECLEPPFYQFDSYMFNIVWAGIASVQLVQCPFKGGDTVNIFLGSTPIKRFIHHNHFLVSVQACMLKELSKVSRL